MTMKRPTPYARPMLTLVLLALASVATAAPLDQPTQQQLLGLFDAYNKAIAAEKLDVAMGMMSNALRDNIKTETKTAKGRKDTMAMMRMMTPDSVSVVHTFIDSGETEARLVTVATKTMPKGPKIPDAPPPGTVMRSGLTLNFVKEAGAWKFDQQMFGQDPTVVTGCKNEVADPPEAYKPNSSVSSGGPVVRVDFKPDYTLVVYSVVGDANCAFLPSKADLAKKGVDPAQLVPYAIVTMDGIAHRTDPQKMLAESVEIQPEE